MRYYHVAIICLVLIPEHIRPNFTAHPMIQNRTETALSSISLADSASSKRRHEVILNMTRAADWLENNLIAVNWVGFLTIGFKTMMTIVDEYFV